MHYRQHIISFSHSITIRIIVPFLSQHHLQHHRLLPCIAISFIVLSEHHRKPSASSSPSLHCHNFHRPLRASPQTSLSPLFAQLVFSLWFLSFPLLPLVSSVIVSQDRLRSQGIDSSQLPTRQPRILPPQPLATCRLAAEQSRRKPRSPGGRLSRARKFLIAQSSTVG